MATRRVRVNRLKDFVERVGWTGIQLAGGAFLAWAETGDAWSWRTFANAVAIAVVKVLVAQRVGKTNDGAAIPGGITDDPR